jgi:hypothetical protein
MWIISSGLTATQAKAGNLRDWVEDTFGAVEIQETQQEVGCTVDGVWRPGLYYDEDIIRGLSTTPVELRLAEQVLLLLTQRLDELLLFVEPTAGTLPTHGHKARELLILACMEVESYWKHWMRKAEVHAPQNDIFTTNQYIRLLAPLDLDEFEVTLPRYAEVPPVRPFHGWSRLPSPTQTLPWYDAYNKTKHDRVANFSDASLWNCIQAVSANIVLFSVRFGPFRLFHGEGALATLFNGTFSMELRDAVPTSFYAPLIRIPENQTPGLVCFESRELTEPRQVTPLVV